MREVYVIGVGMTNFGKSSMTNVEMFATAAAEAIQDANLECVNLEALYLGNVFGDFEEGQVSMAPFAASAIGLEGIPAVRLEAACSSGSMAVAAALMSISAGYYDVVIAGGTERCSVMPTDFATRVFAMSSDANYEYPTGITFPGVFAMVAARYAYKYRIPLQQLKEDMAMVAVKNHANGCLNPKAQFRKVISLETVLNSPIVCDPLQLYDCCPFSDGAAAVILASPEAARRYSKKPVKVIGFGQASAGHLQTQDDITIAQTRIVSAKKAYAMAGISPKDVDVCELHDCFTIAEIVATEALGFCNFGGAGAMIRAGKTQRSGEVAINPSGGLKAKGHPIGATGAAQIYEIAKQIRHEAGDRQVEGARTGLTDTLGGSFNSICNFILQRGW